MADLKNTTIDNNLSVNGTLKVPNLVVYLYLSIKSRIETKYF